MSLDDDVGGRATRSTCDRADGATIVDVDGNEYADFCVGDTGAMAGHSPEPTMRAIARDRRHHDDAAHRGRRLGRLRARAPLRRAVLAVLAHRDRREPLDDPHVPARDRPGPDRASSAGATTARSTSRSCGSTSRGSRARARDSWARRSIPPRPRAWPSSTRSSRCASVLEHGDVACLLMEPALTNIGIVLPEPGLHRRGARALRRARHAPDHRRDAHAQRRPGRLHRRLGPAARRRHARQVDRRRRADRRLRRDARSWPSGSPRRRTPTTRTPAAWAARSPATRSRWRPRAPRSARCSRTRPSSE